MIIVIVLGVIAALAIAAILVDPGEGHRKPLDPHTDLPIWAFLARR